MSRKAPIFYNALLLTGVNLLLRLISTSFQVYLSGRIGAAGIGLLQLVMSVGTLAMTAGMAGVRTASMYLTAEELGKKRPGNVVWVLSGCFLYSILCSGAVSAALYFFAPVIATKWIGNPETVSAIRLYAGFLPTCCLCGVMTGYFTAANRIGTLSAVEVIEQLLYMTITVAIVSLWAQDSPERSCRAVILGSGISCCVTLCSLILLRMREGVKPAGRIPMRSRLLRAAVPLGIADDLRSGISTTENLMVPKRLALFAGVSDPLAQFGTVCGMVFPILMFPAAILFSLAELLIPELARCRSAGSQVRIRYLVKRSLRIAALFGCLCCGMEYLLAKPLCQALYHSEQAGHALQYYALMIPILYCDTVTDAMTKGLGEQKVCVRYNILTSAMDVLLLFLLLPKFGMDGYFFSFCITHLINFVLSLRHLLKITGEKIRFRAAVPGVCCTALSVYIVKHISFPVAQGLLFPAVMVCFLMLLGVVGKEDYTWIRGLIKKREAP